MEVTETSDPEHQPTVTVDDSIKLLIEKERKNQFKFVCRRHSRSMSEMLSEFIDQAVGHHFLGNDASTETEQAELFYSLTFEKLIPIEKAISHAKKLDLWYKGLFVTWDKIKSNPSSQKLRWLNSELEYADILEMESNKLFKSAFSTPEDERGFTAPAEFYPYHHITDVCRLGRDWISLKIIKMREEKDTVCPTCGKPI